MACSRRCSRRTRAASARPRRCPRGSMRGRRAAPSEADAVFLGRDREAGSGIRRSVASERRARHERSLVLVSGLQRAADGRFPIRASTATTRSANPNTTRARVAESQPRRMPAGSRRSPRGSCCPWILNEPRSGIPCNGDGPPIPSPSTERDRAIDEFAADLPPIWGETRLDAPTGLRCARVLQEAAPARALRHARRNRRMGARPPLRSVSRRGAAERSLHQAALGDGAVDAGLRQPHRARVATDHGRGEGTDWTGPRPRRFPRPSASGWRSWARRAGARACDRTSP